MSLDLDHVVFLIEGRSLPVGTRRHWRDGTFVKTKEGWVRDTEVAEPPDPTSSPGMEKLSTQEKVFMALAAEGHSTRRTAAAMRLSVDAVLRMSNSVRTKLGLTPMDSLKDRAREMFK